MAKKPIAPVFPDTKIPKSLGACADKLYDVRQLRLQAEKYAAEIKAFEERLREHIIKKVPKGDTGASGQRYNATVKRERTWRVDAEQWGKFHAWVRKNNRFDLLQKRLSEAAVAELMTEAPKSKQPAGVVPFDLVKVSLTKVK